MIGAESYDRLVQDLYATVTEPARWLAVMTELREAFACTAVSFQYFNDGRDFSQSTMPECSREWVEQWAERCPIRSGSLKVGEIALDHQIIDRSALTATDYYHDFLLQWDIPKILILQVENLEKSLRHGAALNMLRGRRQPEFTPAELAVVRRLSKHAVNAVRSAAALGWRSWAQLTGSLDSETTALVLLGDGGTILHMNPAARALTASRDGLIEQAGQLHALRPPNMARLREAIWRATSGPPPREGAMLTVERPSRGRALIVSIAPLDEPPLMFGRHAPRAIVTIFDPADRRAPTANADLRALFGLTPREEDIAQALASGLTISEAAHQIGVTLVTARNYLARVLRKMECGRQGELVQYICALNRLAIAGKRS